MNFLNERKFDEKGKYGYIHKNLGRADRSLKKNLLVLFTWDKNRALNIPKTINGIDGHFAELKNKLIIYNDLQMERKKKFIDKFFKT